MARSSPTQGQFLGGEWGPLSYGSYTDPAYKTAVEISMNGLPVEGGGWIRRSGFGRLGPTYLRGKAKLLPFQSNAALPFALEFTDGSLRIWYGPGLVCTADRQVITASSSSAGVISLTTTTNHGWSVGDQLLIYCPTTVTAADATIVANRVLQIMTQDGTTGLTAEDDLSTALPSDISSGGLNGATAIRIKRFDSTGIASSTFPNVRLVQAQTHGFVLSSAAPQVLTCTTERTALLDTEPVLTFGAATFIDGPYLDYQGFPGTAETGTVSGGSTYSGSGVTFTPASSTFVASDVGRLIRLFSQPAAWASGTTYTYGETVTYPAGTTQYWIAIDKSGTNTNQVPGAASIQTSGIPLQYWAPSPTEGQWAWATITAQASSSCTITYTTALNSNNGATVTEWQLGVYKSGQYPTCGVFHEGRLFLGGAIANRFDACVSNGVADSGVTFSPTDVYGNQNDDNAFGGYFNFDKISTIHFFMPDTSGLIVGTDGGEILLSASTIDDALTPTNIRARRVAKYQAANVEALQTGICLLYVQSLGRKMQELLPDAFTGKYGGHHINEHSKHLFPSGIKETAYQEETVPVVWALTNDGTLLGCTYRRISRFITDPPIFNGWHQHPMSAGYLVDSITVTVSAAGLNNALYASVLDPNGEYWVELMQPLFEDT